MMGCAREIAFSTLRTLSIPRTIIKATANILHNHTDEKTALRASLQKEAPMRVRVYPMMMAAGVMASMPHTMAGVAPLGSRVSVSTAHCWGRMIT